MGPWLTSERVERSRFVPRWVQHEHRARYDFAARFVTGHSVVDCACGDGASTETFLRLGAKRIWAFDISPKAVNAVRRRCDSSRVHCQLADGRHLPLLKGCAEVYVSLETIEHISDEEAFLHEVARVLTRDGVFICSTPNRAVTNPGRDLTSPPWNRFHVREYSAEEPAVLLEEWFMRVTLFGQNPQLGWKLRMMGRVGQLGNGHLAVHINQFLKLPGLILDKRDSHVVQEMSDGRVFEYVVAVCRQPRGYIPPRGIEASLRTTWLDRDNSQLMRHATQPSSTSVVGIIAHSR